MIILGIDPGTTRIGFGVIKNQEKGFSCLDYGIIGNKGVDKFFDFKRTEFELINLVERYKPDLIGIEKLFFFKNKKTVMAVSEMKGSILLSLSKCNIPIREFTPLQVKQAISGYGKADKGQIEKMVKLILKIESPIKPDDAADALAIAICCANTIVY